MSKPIDHAIVRDLVSRAAARLAMHQAQGLLSFSNANILATSGVPLGPSDRLVCTLLNSAGEVVLICPAFEEPEPAELPPHSRVFTWLEHEDPFQTTARAADSLRLTSATILVDPKTWCAALERLRVNMPKASLRPDPDVMGDTRLRKSAAEIAAIQAANAHVGSIYPALTSRIRAGVAEADLAAAALAALPDGPLLRAMPLLQSGPNASIPHRPTGTRKLADGDCVIADYYVPRGGYWGDMTRTYAIGKPADAARAAYRAVRAAQRAGIAACRPGAACEDVDRAARKVIEDAGLGKYFCHRLGHGIGLEGHEPPYLVEGNKTPLAPGMCVTVEPGVYVPGQFGIRIEDVVVITPEGCRSLSDTVPTDVSDVFQE